MYRSCESVALDYRWTSCRQTLPRYRGVIRYEIDENSDRTRADRVPIIGLGPRTARELASGDPLDLAAAGAAM